MLARLISAQQVVLFRNSFQNYLFYQGTVYSRPMDLGFECLPNHPKMNYFPIWALINMGTKDQEPPITPDSNIWPVQSSSQNPV